jgi:hypothetical protein
VITFRETDFGHYAYGYGAAKTFLSACHRACIEMGRHESVVRRRWALNQQAEVAPITGLFERRAWYFSLPAGHAQFLEAVKQSASSSNRPKAVQVFDGQIPGPWSKYAKVWRVVYEMPSLRYLTEGATHFFW